MSSSLSTSVWYLDIGASCHMTGCREFVSSLREEDIDLQIELGDNGKYKAVVHGTITFYRKCWEVFLVL